MTLDDSFDVVLCPSCSGKSWIIETNKRRYQSTVACPHCGQERDTEKLKIVATADEWAGAAEERARYHATKAGEEETYNRLATEHGPYNKQLDAVDDLQRDVSDSALNLTIGTLNQQIKVRYGPTEDRDGHLNSGGLSSFDEDQARFETLAEYRMERSRFEHRERFADQASDSVVSADELIEDYHGEPADDDSSRYIQDTEPVAWGGRADRDDLVTGEVTPTDQTHAWLQLDLDEGATLSTVWESFFSEERVQKIFAASIRRLLEDHTVAESHELLEELQIPHWLRAPILNAARGNNREAWRIAVDVVPEMHEFPQVAVEDLLATAQLFAGFDGHLSIATVVHESWLDRRRDQREDICDLLSVLAANLEVKVCASGLVLNKVVDAHRLDLPGVSDWRSRGQSSSGFADLVNEALAGLEKDGREVDILRTLYENNGGPLAYRELYAEYLCDNSRIRQCLGQLNSYELINQFGPRNDRKVELLEAGEAVLEAFDREIARQRRIESFVNGAGQSSPKGRVSPQTRSPPDGGSSENTKEDNDPWTTQYLKTPQHVSAVASAENGSVTLVSGGINESADRTRWASYDPDRDEAVIAVKAADPLTYVASSAIALASPRFIDRALTSNRLSSIDDPPIIVREARCIGGASDDALDNPSELRSNLIDWGKEIEDMTRRLKHGEYEDRNAFRSEILRKSHGLFGSIAHLLDAVGIDLVREIRVPAGADKDRQLGELAKSIAVSAAIQSKYRDVFACYRQLFEKREEKRERALTPTIDATNPYGNLIGSIVVRGPDIHRLEPKLRHYLENPAEENDDALEIAVTVPIQYVDRNAFAEVAARILSMKNIRPTRETVSLFYALVESPHDLAYGLQNRLIGEDTPRELRPDEARKALAAVSHEALCPDLAPSVGKILVTLLEAERPLCKGELAERSDVSKKTVDRYKEKLEALGLLLTEDNEYRLALSFPEKSERRNSVLPELVTRSDAWGATLDVVDELLVSSLPADRYADPNDPVGGVLWYPQEPLALLDHSEFGPWIELGVLLLGEELPSRESDLIASMGPGPAMIQKSLPIKSPSRDSEISL